MRVKFLKNHSGWAKGKEAILPDETAENLIRREIAQRVKVSNPLDEVYNPEGRSLRPSSRHALSEDRKRELAKLQRERDTEELAKLRKVKHPTYPLLARMRALQERLGKSQDETGKDETGKDETAEAKTGGENAAKRTGKTG